MTGRRIECILEVFEPSYGCEESWKARSRGGRSRPHQPFIDRRLSRSCSSPRCRCTWGRRCSWCRCSSGCCISLGPFRPPSSGRSWCCWFMLFDGTKLRPQRGAGVTSSSGRFIPLRIKDRARDAPLFSHRMIRMGRCVAGATERSGRRDHVGKEQAGRTELYCEMVFHQLPTRSSGVRPRPMAL